MKQEDKERIVNQVNGTITALKNLQQQLNGLSSQFTMFQNQINLAIDSFSNGINQFITYANQLEIENERLEKQLNDCNKLFETDDNVVEEEFGDLEEMDALGYDA